MILPLFAGKLILMMAFAASNVAANRSHHGSPCKLRASYLKSKGLKKRTIAGARFDLPYRLNYLKVETIA